jgi:hypothetical protein
MNIEKVNKLKLLENEVVSCLTYKIACAVCDLADTLGFKWNSKESYCDRSNYSLFRNNGCYNLHKGVLFHKKDLHDSEEIKIIPGVEWLNRHGVFIFSQQVTYRTTKKKSLKKGTYIAPHVVVPESELSNYIENRYFKTVLAEEINSPCPKWDGVQEDPTITFSDGTSIKLSLESYNLLKNGAVKYEKNQTVY